MSYKNPKWMQDAIDNSGTVHVQPSVEMMNKRPTAEQSREATRRGLASFQASQAAEESDTLGYLDELGKQQREHHQEMMRQKYPNLYP